MIYFISILLWISSFLILKKSDDKRNLIIEAVFSIFAYLTWQCTISGIYTILHIPANDISVTMLNIVISLFIIGMVIYKKKWQYYYFDFLDFFCVLAIFIFAVYAFNHRFGDQFAINFSTSDPATHLKYIMNFVNSQKVEGLFYSQTEFGYVIDALCGSFISENVYKVFIIMCGINLAFGGAIFYVALRLFFSSRCERILAIIASAIYLLGYPYNDFLFGFVYLQLTISTICYMLIVLKYYSEDTTSDNIYEILLSMACATVGVGYTLFAPPVYFASLFCILYKLFSRNGLKIWLIVTKSLKVYVMPCLLTLWAVVFNAKSDMVGGVAYEGYIYRNLYSDFLILSVGVVYWVIQMIMKKSEINFFSMLLPIFLLYMSVIFYFAYRGTISTYYYYKLNYLLWLLFVFGMASGLSRMFENDRGMFFALIIVYCIVTILFLTKADDKVKEKNELLNPNPVLNSIFWIYYMNDAFSKWPIEIPDDFVDICSYANRYDCDVIYLGDWLNSFWYEALTNQRFSQEYYDNNIQQNYDLFIEGKYGEYAIIEKSDEVDVSLLKGFENFIVYENDAAYVLSNGQDVNKENEFRIRWRK